MCAVCSTERIDEHDGRSVIPLQRRIKHIRRYLHTWERVPAIPTMRMRSANLVLSKWKRAFKKYCIVFVDSSVTMEGIDMKNNDDLLVYPPFRPTGVSDIGQYTSNEAWEAPSARLLKNATTAACENVKLQTQRLLYQIISEDLHGLIRRLGEMWLIVLCHTCPFVIPLPLCDPFTWSSSRRLDPLWRASSWRSAPALPVWCCHGQCDRSLPLTLAAQRDRLLPGLARFPAGKSSCTPPQPSILQYQSASSSSYHSEARRNKLTVNPWSKFHIPTIGINSQEKSNSVMKHRTGGSVIENLKDECDTGDETGS